MPTDVVTADTQDGLAVIPHQIGARLQPPRATLVGSPPPWPLIGAVAVRVEIPVAAARPDGPREGLAQFAMELVGNLAADLDLPLSGSVQFGERGKHMAHARLDYEDHRSSSAIGVRTVEQKHVRERRNTHP